MTLSDISYDALKIAQRNSVIVVGFGDSQKSNIRTIQSDLFEKIEEKFDFIVSNPPYIETKTIQERAKEFALDAHDFDCGNCDTCGKCKEYRKYVDIVTEQRKIDIEKACELIEKALQKLTTYKDKDNFTENEFKIITASRIPNWLIKFRKAMEK